MKSGKKNLYLGSETFWADIHRYIDDRRYEIENRREEQRQKTPHRKCPDCLQLMEVEELHRVLIDRCSNCGGVFLDKDELDLLFKTNQESGFIPSLKRFYKSKE